MKSCIVVVSGASGSVYGLRLVEQLNLAGVSVTFMATRAGREVMAFETGFALPESGGAEALARFLELAPGETSIRVVDAGDLFDRAASGTSAADVMLKERRRLVVVPRETPLSLVHLRNLTSITEAGAIVVPAMPAFYQRPVTLDDMVNFVVGKVLDVLGIEHSLYRRWGE